MLFSRPARARVRRCFWLVIGCAAGVVRILWVCRVGVINVASSLLFFAFVVQAQNLMADLSFAGTGHAILFWLGVFVATFLLWAFPVHYAARRSLDQLVRRLAGRAPALQRLRHHPCLVAWLPRLLGLAPFWALWLGIRGAQQAVGGAITLPTARDTIEQSDWLLAADLAFAVAFLLFILFRRPVVAFLAKRLLGGRLRGLGSFFRAAATLVTAAIFVAAYLAPIATSVLVPRALLVPPLFGSLVLVSSYLTRLADRTGFPFLATAALGLGLLAAANTDFNAVRTLENVDGDQRLTMKDAVSRWKAANGCATGPCPRPLIVAIDGGASRAAFTAATFVGELLDRMPTPGAAEAKTPGRRLFAISGVSGGSYGAAVIQAAVLDAELRGDGSVPPCRSAQTTWFGFKAKGDAPFTWRQCLQALTSGDYLSPTIIGLAFRDFIAPPWPTIPDRAALLEMTWERQYAATTASGGTSQDGGCDAGPPGATGLCRRMAHPGAALVGPARWMPMLLLNGTSVATGRRIVASDLRSDEAQGAGGSGSLYPQAYDLREIMTNQCPLKPPPIEALPVEAPGRLAAAGKSDGDARTLSAGICAQAGAAVDGPDVRLSTAALTSARFPIISPAGIFKMETTIYGDQVVDGGYFENSGLTTARDIVAAMKGSGLEPIVVSISNNPAYDVPDEDQLKACEGRYRTLNGGARFTPAVCTGLPRRPATTPLVPPIDNTYAERVFAIVLRPFQALVATGAGHADEVFSKIVAEPPPGGFVHLKVEVKPNFDLEPGDRVFADRECDGMAGRSMEMSKVSMSWWLAAAVQSDLDIQRCARRNRLELKRVVGLLQNPGTPP